MQSDTSNNRAVIVLGMHRSGTSCLAGSLQRRGLYLGEVQEFNPHNAKGNRESRRIMHLNDAVLSNGGGAWDRPLDVVSWSSEHVDERDRIVASLQTGHRRWGFKDPRTLLALPFWLERIPDPAFVGAFRHPANVARSLYKRSHMPPDQAYALWLEYNKRLLDLHSRRPFPLVSFDLDDASYSIQIDHAARQLGLDSIGDAAEEFFEPSLRSSADDQDMIPEPPAGLTRLHGALIRSSRDQRT